MDFDYSPKVKDMQARLLAFMDKHIYPNENAYYDEVAANRAKGNAWIPTQIIEQLKPKARAPACGTCSAQVHARPEGLSNLEYAPLARSWAACLGARGLQLLGARHRQHGDHRALRQRGQQGPVAGAPAARRDPLGLPDDRAGRRLVGRHQHRVPHRARRRHYVINGRKWWSSGAGDPRCAVYIVMGKTDPEAPRHSQQSMILVPAGTPGVKVIRALTVFGMTTRRTATWRSS
jgi:acyl-CoA dehydrogenase